MPFRTDGLHEARRRWKLTAREIGDELLTGRRVAGISQRQVAAGLGISQSTISRRERAILDGASLRDVAIHAAAVGLRLSVKLWPAGGALRDGVQVRYIAAFVSRVGARWRVALEATVPQPGDLRAADVLLTSGGLRVVVEVITRLTDVQAQVRAAQVKARDLGATRLVIVLAATRGNRSAVGAAHAALAQSFDLDTRHVMTELAAGRDPGRDAIILLTA